MASLTKPVVPPKSACLIQAGDFTAGTGAVLESPAIVRSTWSAARFICSMGTRRVRSLRWTRVMLSGALAIHSVAGVTREWRPSTDAHHQHDQQERGPTASGMWARLSIRRSGLKRKLRKKASTSGRNRPRATRKVWKRASRNRAGQQEREQGHGPQRTDR